MTHNPLFGFEEFDHDLHARPLPKRGQGHPQRRGAPKGKSAGSAGNRRKPHLGERRPS